MDGITRLQSTLEKREPIIMIRLTVILIGTLLVFTFSAVAWQFDKVTPLCREQGGKEAGDVDVERMWKRPVF